MVRSFPRIVIAAKFVDSRWNGSRNKLGKTLSLCVILQDDPLHILTCNSFRKL